MKEKRELSANFVDVTILADNGANQIQALGSLKGSMSFLMHHMSEMLYNSDM